MTLSIICPRCGAENLSTALNCAGCRIHLKFAQENPAEIERIKREDARRQVDGGAIEHSPGLSETNHKPVLLPALLLLGSFAFAFCLGEAVHELGHFLMHRINGVSVGVRLDPFGGSRIINGSSAPRDTWGITSLAGPLFDLMVGMTVTLALWRVRKPILLPFLIWGPLSLVMEGVTFTLGMLTPGGDAQWIVEWGFPAPLLTSLGGIFLE